MATSEPYILFELAGTAYAVPSASVQRMEMIEHVTPVPNAPAFLDGVVFSRGRVVPAINLRCRFGFARAAYDPKTRLIVVAHADRAVGLIVDSAREFVNIPLDAIQPPPEGLAGTSGNYLSGIATVGARVVLILNVAEVLNHTGGPTAVAPPEH
ncbi:purine-binding chemotaxis protein CheW [Gemmata sp. G18]|uniref:Purine-binding chemotaxis protein CheW n=1 Tax=Gemmata palustris TaxID=2822762 RepID=A0ABS5BLC4_9BACT|nr:chemotaxis protein CheW [Gemmata palustris]MBP3954465.1 purine-binding chemotaxis protein CheW [Gemmata palustris]